MPEKIFTVEELIPHRDRMKLVDEIIETSDETAVTASIATDQWPLYQNGSIDSLIAVELVAQTAGVCIGAKRRRESGSGGGRGWIVGIKNAEFHVPTVPVNTRLITKARVLYGQEAYSVIEGIVSAEEQVISNVSLQVFREEFDK